MKPEELRRMEKGFEMHKIGFLGCGNMGRAIVGGILSKGIVSPSEIIASARSRATIDAVHGDFGIDVTLGNVEACKADIVFLAVKPQMY